MWPLVRYIGESQGIFLSILLQKRQLFHAFSLVFARNRGKRAENSSILSRFWVKNGRAYPHFTLTTLTPSHLPSRLNCRYVIDYKKCEGVRVENKIRMRGMFTLKYAVCMGSFRGYILLYR